MLDANYTNELAIAINAGTCLSGVMCARFGGDSRHTHTHTRARTKSAGREFVSNTLLIKSSCSWAVTVAAPCALLRKQWLECERCTCTCTRNGTVWNDTHTKKTPFQLATERVRVCVRQKSDKSSTHHGIVAETKIFKIVPACDRQRLREFWISISKWFAETN